MYEVEQHKNLSKRLHYLCGQLKGIDKMLAQNRNENDILIQLLAVESGLQKVIYQHFDELLRKSLALRINKLYEQKNLSKENLKTLDAIRKNFPYYKLRQLPKIIYQLSLIENKYRRKK